MTKLDFTFARDVYNISNGDGTREARFAFMRDAKAVAKELSCPKAPYIFNYVVQTHGRVAVAVCVAVTILAHQDRLESKSIQWAQQVMQLWHNRPSCTDSLLILDGLHPTRIEEYAGSFIRLTSVEVG